MNYGRPSRQGQRRTTTREPRMIRATSGLRRPLAGRRFAVVAWAVLSMPILSAISAGASPATTVVQPAQTPRARIPDVELIDQHGKRHRFYSDLVRGRLVLMNAMYTRCRGTCPMQATVFAQAARLVRQRQDLPVQILSVSLEPEVDTPERLASFAARYDAGNDWLFLTGRPEDVKAVLEAMDLAAPRPEEHTPLCVVGHEESGTWMKMVNLAAPAEIVSRLEFVRGRAGARRGK